MADVPIWAAVLIGTGGGAVAGLINLYAPVVQWKFVEKERRASDLANEHASKLKAERRERLMEGRILVTVIKRNSSHDLSSDPRWFPLRPYLSEDVVARLESPNDGGDGPRRKITIKRDSAPPQTLGVSPEWVAHEAGERAQLLADDIDRVERVWKLNLDD